MREFIFTLKIAIICTLQFFTNVQAQNEGVVNYIYFQDLGVPEYMKAALYFNMQEAVYYKENFRYDSNKYVSKPGERLVIETDVENNSPTLNFRCHLSRIKGKMNCLENLLVAKSMYVEEKTPTIKWAIQDSLKTFSTLTAQKAVGYFRGRTYHVWFTKEIPVPYGPWKLGGLPGLILEAEDESGRIKFIFNGISKEFDKEKLSFTPKDFLTTNIIDFQKIKKEDLIEDTKQMMAKMGIRDAQLLEVKEAPDEFKLEFDFEWETKKADTKN